MEQQQTTSYGQELRLLGAFLFGLHAVYLVLPRLPRGLPRLAFLIPALAIFVWVPFFVRLCVPRTVLAFLFLWILPNKLILRCWDIFADYPAEGFLYFIVTSALPLRVKGRSRRRSEVWTSASLQTVRNSFFLPLFHICALLATSSVLRHSGGTSRWLTHLLYCLVIYFSAEGLLGLLRGLASLLLRLELHPLFNNPFLSSSLSDFWGRRWNLLVSYMLRETVYSPVLVGLSRQETGHGTLAEMTYSKEPKAFDGNTEIHLLRNPDSSLDVPASSENKWVEQGVQSHNVADSVKAIECKNVSVPPLHARAVAMFLSFLVSGLLHELLLYCISQRPPSWEMTCFFAVHGVASVSEVFIRRKFPNRRRFPKPIAILCTLAFVYFTSVWLFMPPFVRSGVTVQVLTEIHHAQKVILDLFSKKRH
ncbi:hypothetical protein KP509_22G030500 [Ceratopteris richardii]|uniref:Wax synthase domain-containing protein n=1 Tax=Ceratopteris richardii TaxID=49495 RepID=A0A8T2S6G7_CERRI|nr:hypothetical protein KP509_22G030500 [Ceratopteris richardii]KAH7306791.1 hypothetical protein KP509_22G030500 [Ceratopteris richardii]